MRLSLVFLEFFVVVTFGIGWLILELVTRRYDKPRHRDAERASGQDRPQV